MPFKGLKAGGKSEEYLTLVHTFGAYLTSAVGIAHSALGAELFPFVFEKPVLLNLFPLYKGRKNFFKAAYPSFIGIGKGADRPLLPVYRNSKGSADDKAVSRYLLVPVTS